MNSINIIGRMTKKAEINKGREHTYARFTLAVYRDKDNADFIPCVAFNKNAELLDKYCQKGSQIGIEGRLQSGSYTTQSGDKRYTLEVIVNRIDLVGSVQEKQTEKADDYESIEPTQHLEINDEDLPFY